MIFSYLMSLDMIFMGLIANPKILNLKYLIMITAAWKHFSYNFAQFHQKSQRLSN
jgi:hypothetical protein